MIFEKVIEETPNLEINQFLIPKGQKFDLLFVGNSRTKHHLNPTYFLEKGIKSKNLGITGGTTLVENYFLLNEFLQQNTVKLMLIEYLPSTPMIKPKCFHKFRMFYGKDFLDKYFKYYNYKESIKVPYFRYILNNYNFRNLLHDIFLLSSDQKNHGFVSKKGNLNSVTEVSQIRFKKPDRYYFEIKELAKKYNVKLVYIISPMFNKKIIATEIPSDVFDFSNCYNEPNLFFDDFHLNAKGAELFTKLIYDKLYFHTN